MGGGGGSGDLMRADKRKGERDENEKRRRLN